MDDLGAGRRTGGDLDRAGSDDVKRFRAFTLLDQDFADLQLDFDKVLGQQVALGSFDDAEEIRLFEEVGGRGNGQARN